jgi:hypothetical protein
MRTTAYKFATMAVGAAALCASALPSSANSWIQPGGTMGAPAGALPPPGLYFVSANNYGISQPSPSTSIGVAVQAFVWNPGWTFLGASYAASAANVLIEVGVHNAAYLRGVYNPYINPVTLSWNLGNGFFASFGEGIYLPLNTDITNPGNAFEQRFSVSYLANDWVMSANSIYTVTTAGDGVRTPESFNLDLTFAHTFGKWEFGAVGYGSWDTETTSLNRALGKGEAIGIGPLLGYNFGPVDLTLMATHQVVTHGTTVYGRDDTRVWANVVIPIWNPTSEAPKPLVAKY